MILKKNKNETTRSKTMYNAHVTIYYMICRPSVFSIENWTHLKQPIERKVLALGDSDSLWLGFKTMLAWLLFSLLIVVPVYSIDDADRTMEMDRGSGDVFYSGKRAVMRWWVMTINYKNVGLRIRWLRSWSFRPEWSFRCRTVWRWRLRSASLPGRISPGRSAPPWSLSSRQSCLRASLEKFTHAG